MGKIEPEVSGFFRAPKSVTAINTCLDGMEEFSGYPKNLLDGTLSEVNFSVRHSALRKQTKKDSRENNTICHNISSSTLNNS